MGGKIVRACDGLPLAVKVIGSMLQTAKEEKWRAVSENTDLWDTSNIKDGIHPAIRLSYQYLPASLKRCFEYLAVFPPDHKFEKDEVVRLWIADGLVEEVEGRRVEDIGNEYYNELEARSLIQNSLDGYHTMHGYYTMHDIIQHLATVVSRKYCYKENSKENLASVRHAFLVNPNSMHYRFLAQAPYLRTLIDERHPEDENVLPNIIQTWKMLKTLKIDSDQNYSLGETSICHLTHLRYLRIDDLYSSHLLDSVCMLDNLKFLVLYDMHLNQLPEDIGNLRSLRALHLRYSSISRSLHESICSLCELQVLELRSCKELKVLPKDIGNLRSLQTLALQWTSISSLPESICSLCELQVLDLRSCKELKVLPKDIGNLRSLRTLVLQWTSISSLPESICSLCELQVLDLQYCEELKELPKDIGNLRSLRTLPLQYTSISSIPESICSLCELQVLDLYQCVELKELPKGIGNLRSLSKLALQWTSISSLPESICSLCELQVLDLYSCKELKDLPKDIGNLRSLSKLDLQWTSISSLPESICSLCELKILVLENCKKLKELPKDIGNLRSLRTLNLRGTSILSVPESILNVTGLQNLFVSKSIQLSLHIGRLKGLLSLPFYHVEKEEGQRLGELSPILTIGSMENIGGVEEAEMADLKSKKNLTHLKFHWSQPGNDEEMEVKIMEALEPHHALESLTFSNYGGNKFPAWITAGNIRWSNLTMLIMEGLNIIWEMIDMEFVSLRTLKIKNCPKLRKVLMATPKLWKLCMNNCGELETDCVHLLPSLSDEVGPLSIVSRLEKLKCEYKIFEYFFEKLKTQNSKWDKLCQIKLNAGGRRVASLPGGWQSMMDCIFKIKIGGIGPGKFRFLPDGDQRPFPPSLICFDINNRRIFTKSHPRYWFSITSDGEVEWDEESE